MTQNQLAYATLLENKRHNVEGEQHNRNVLAETSRHNVATEAVQKYSADVNRAHYERLDSETQRHNLANESLESGKLKETQRHNIINEAIDYGKLQVSQEANRIQSYQAQTGRINSYSQGLQAQASLTQASASQSQADTAKFRAQTDQYRAQTEERLATSNIGLNQIRGEDYYSQIDRREHQSETDTLNAASNLTKAITSGFRDITDGAGNVINLIGKVWSLAK